MPEARPFASLSSGLLARKGAAKPAMRPQAFGQVAASLDDLGWNDMGGHDATEEHVPSPVSGLTPSPRLAVEEQQRAIADSFEVEQELRPAPVPTAVPAPVVPIAQRREIRARDKAAFTLRLDPERHFRLRLACAVTGRSAQQIVTGALDQILDTIPELDALAGQIPAMAARRS